MKHKAKQAGFSIVELLIVILVIGILAGIVIASYTSVQNNAHDEAVKKDLRNTADKLEIFYLDNKRYPTVEGTYVDLKSLNLDLSDSYHSPNRLLYCGGKPSNNGQSFGIVGITKNDRVWVATNNTGIKEITDLPSYSGGVVCPAILGEDYLNFSWSISWLDQ